MRKIRERQYGLGCEAGYDDAVRPQSRQWAERQGGGVYGTFVPLKFGRGEANRLDWNHGPVRLSGRQVQIKAAQFVSCHGSMPFVRCYPSDT